MTEERPRRAIPPTPRKRAPPELPPRYRLLLALVAAAVYVFTYVPVGRLPDGLHSVWPRYPVVRVEVPRLPFERALPITPEAVLVYVSVLPVGAAAFLARRSVRETERLFCAFLASVFGCASVHLLLPTSVPRDRVIVGTGPWQRTLAWLWRIDPPHNALPSLHLMAATVFALHLARGVSALWRVLAALWVALVWAATVLTGQHALVDGAVGIALGVAVDWWVGRDQDAEEDPRGVGASAEWQR